MSVDKNMLFNDLHADTDPEITEIESLCMNCQANGITRLLLTKIPFYKEVIIMSFHCNECGYENNEIQSGAQIAEKGIQITLKVETPTDLNRQVVKSDFTSLRIAELDFEIPAKSQKGEITTVEGILERSIIALQQDQPHRKLENAEVAVQIDEFINKLKELKTVSKPFTLILNDISGNSFIENPNAPQKDPSCTVHYFVRTKEQNHELGIFTKSEVQGNEEDALLHPITENEFPLEDFEREVIQFATNCNVCGSSCETNMKVINIPHFKEVIIMATVCETCGNRTNEVKSGSGIEAQGVHIEVDIKNSNDLTRDVLKSETCHLSIPQFELEVGPSAVSGRFTTVEGLLVAIKEQLNNNIFGDSQDQERKTRLSNFLKQFDEVFSGTKQITLCFDDPAGNSYIQSMNDDDTLDTGLRITHYKRSFDQNEELGLNDMKTENYEKL